MAISSGLRHTFSEAASWLTAGALIVAGLAYHDELRGGIAGVLGVGSEAAVAETRPAGRPQEPQISAAEVRARQAEARAAEAEARARQAEARARAHEASVARLPERRVESGRQRMIFASTVELKAGRNGHYYAKADLNGRPVDVLVDTGASMVALTYEDAERAGIRVSSSDFTGRSNTANGVARFAPVTIDSIAIGSITVRNVQGSVAEPGRLHVTLLGMSFIGRLSRAEMKDGMLVLQE